MSLEERIRRIEDRTAIIETLHEYCRHCDTFNIDSQVSLFTEDCVVSYVKGLPDMHGQGALRKMLSTYYPNSVSSQHMIANTELVFESDDVVIVNAYMYSWQRFKDFPVMADCHRWGRYEDRLIRTSKGWRFTHMRLLSHGEYGGARIGEQLGRPWPPRF